ncbi:hypothetical protein WAI453_010616 [Rhynchosporium graminicola]
MVSIERLAGTACRTDTLQLVAFTSPRIYASRKSLSTRIQPFCSPTNLHTSKQHLPRSPQPLYRCFSTSQSSLSNPKFSYGIAASFTAKDRRYNPDTNVFNFNPYNHIRARRKDKRTRPASGQDAFFVSRVGESSDVALGVADGVGGWVDSGVDPADFAHGICDYMAHAAYTHKAEEWNPPLGAQSLMQRGYDDIRRDDSVKAGGSTACVAVAKGDGKLEVANLGDSGFVQLRLNAIHDYSDPQTHAFNTPYQLSIVPEKVLAQAAFFGGEQLRDMPADANISQHELRHGDVLVIASDGVWDNLSSQDILRIVSKVMLGAKAWQHTDGGVGVGKNLSDFTVSNNGKGPAQNIPSLQSFLAVAITSQAKSASMNNRVDGPFAREVQRYYPHENWSGGKVDDICVVVAVVVEEGK